MTLKPKLMFLPQRQGGRKYEGRRKHGKCKQGEGSVSILTDDFCSQECGGGSRSEEWELGFGWKLQKKRLGLRSY